jgi:phosphoglycolate phosphatase
MKVSAVIFDLDGTLTQPYFDFDKIRKEIGIPGGPILEAIEAMAPAQKRQAEEILHRHERLAAENSRLNAHVHKVLAGLRGEGLALGLVTRNQRACVAYVCQRHDLVFDAIVTREDGPVKPDPFPVRRVCEIMGVQPAESVVVGDYLFDLISANRAGAASVLLSTSQNYKDYAHEADYVIHGIDELPGVIAALENCSVI